ncbi:hypothetical protein, partial [Streptomyces yangpuensis]|uniref:hypothetical protein n=1 Tax=Streptomyces yangpuensis TaxID=1648182 RepID=UPI0035E2AC62
MSALDDIRRALSDAYGTGVALHDLTADDLIRSAVAEFEMDAEAYPGGDEDELAARWRRDGIPAAYEH